MSKTETKTETETDKSRGAGRTRRTKEECQEAFNAFTEALGLDNLALNVDPKTGKCTAARVENGVYEPVLGPVAGNTFITQLEGALAFAKDIARAS